MSTLTALFFIYDQRVR